MLVRRIRSVAKVERIILFGSAADGCMNLDSDLDILVLKAGRRIPRGEAAKIREAIGHVGYPVDVIVMPVARFERFKETIGGIEYPANRYGKILYATRSGATA
jgi:predicted nucleotidyltransferase